LSVKDGAYSFQISHTYRYDAFSCNDRVDFVWLHKNGYQLLTGLNNVAKNRKRVLVLNS